MHTTFWRQKTGFTVIELLVVIGILAFLSAIVVTAVLQYETKAKVSRVKADEEQFLKAAYLAVSNSGTSLYNLVGPGSPEYNGNCTNRDLKNVPDSDSCVVAWLAALNKIQTAAGVTGLTGMQRDPWNSPYVFDAVSTCGSDM